MKKLFLLCACLLVLAAPLRAAAPPEIVVVRIYESVRNVTAIITRAEGKSEKVEFEKGGTDRHLTQSSEGYYKLFQQFYQQGYVLQASFVTPDTGGGGYTTLLFVKPS